MLPQAFQDGFQAWDQGGDGETAFLYLLSDDKNEKGGAATSAQPRLRLEANPPLPTGPGERKKG